MYAMVGSHVGERRGGSDDWQKDRLTAVYPKSVRWSSVLAGALNGPMVSICMAA